MRILIAESDYAIVVLGVPSRQHLLGGVNLIKDVFEEYRLRTISPPNMTDRRFEYVRNSRSLGGAVLNYLDG